MSLPPTRTWVEAHLEASDIVAMMEQLGPVIDEIVDSYKEIGGINHIEGPRLPSRLHIVQIIEDLESIIFPGYHDEERSHPDSLRFVIEERLSRVARCLTDEIHKALCFQRGIDMERPCGHEVETHEIEGCHDRAERLTADFLAQVPSLRKRLRLDVDAAMKGDPAAQSREEVILAYPGVEAVLVHRLAHELFVRGVPLLPRMMSEWVHGRTGIDIHPGATIGASFFIDHATGVVIGETCVIGDRVKIYQGVTLGAMSVRKEEAHRKRHPTIGDDVTVYSGATILGGDTEIGTGSVIGGNVWLTRSVPPNSTVFYKAGDFVVTRTPEPSTV